MFRRCLFLASVGSACSGPVVMVPDATTTAGYPALFAGASLWSVMIVHLVFGAADAREYAAIAADANREPRPPTADERERLAYLGRVGRLSNTSAAVAGVFAGGFTAAAVGLLVRAGVDRRAARGLRPLVVPRGGGVGWQLRF